MAREVQIKGMTVEVYAGATINGAVLSAIELAKTHGCSITFTFNNRSITVDGQSDPDQIVRWWGEIVEAYFKAKGARVTPTGIKWGDSGR